MRAGHLKAALLSILVAASLAVPLLALADTSEAKVHPLVDNIFVRGKGTAYSYNSNPPAPLKTYVQDDYPPMVMAKEIGSGRVVASGIEVECRMTPASDNFVALMDAIFQWLSSGKNVLWFNGHAVYCNSSLCDNLIKKLGARGYAITGDATTPITPSMLAPYDILVLPQMQEGRADNGGDPSKLLDSEVQAIKGFVEGGKGLLVMCGSDFFGPSGNKGNFFNLMNKVLIALGFGWGNELFGFQSDSVYDDINNAKDTTDVPTPGGNNYRPIVDVDPGHWIGAKYQDLTGRTTVRAYGSCSLVKLGPGIAMYIVPSYQVGMPGETITYRVRVFNTGIPIPGAENVDLTIDLTVVDDSGWSLTLDNYLIRLAKGENQTVILSVTIPSGTRLCTEDEIIVTATAREYSDVREDYICIAHAAKRLEVTQDAYVDSATPEDPYGGENSLYIGRYMENWQYAYLMFENLAEIPDNANITEARLYLFAWSAYGAAQEMLACGVADDGWYEPAISWNDKPAYGATLDTKVVSVGGESEPAPYYWDVTSFVKQQFAGDKIASFCVRPADNCPPSTNRRFESREWWDTRLRPFLRVNYTRVGVSVSISPRENRAGPENNVTFTVTVKNEGAVPDTYSLSTTDNAGWSRTISPSLLSLAGGASGTATLTVTIPSGAENNARDNVRVTATGTGVSAENSCIARAYIGPIPGVSVSISPTSQDGSPGTALTYTVTVTNTGGVADNYVLTKSDDLDWSPSLSPSSLSLAAGASGTATLTVTLGSSGTDTITVTATSQTDSTVSGSANCTAHVVSVVGRVKVTIDQSSKSGAPGESLNYSVTVKNEGTSTDTFSLQATDTKGWSPTLSITSITLPGGSSRTGIRLSIKIPDNAADGDSNTITVTAIGSGYENSATCTTKAASGGTSPLVYVGAAVVVVVIIAAVLIKKPF